MTNAAAPSSLRVAAITPSGSLRWRSSGTPSTSGMTETPVSNPLIPRASLGKIRAEATRTAVQSPPRDRAARQLARLSGWFQISTRPRASTIRFRSR